MFFFGYSGQEIYDNFHSGRGSEGLVGGATIVHDVAKSYTDRVHQIANLLARMEPAWQGSAAGSAQRGAGPLLVEHELSSVSLVTAQDLTNRQAGSFGDAKNAVVPMPPKPKPANPMAMLVSPAAVLDFELQVDAYGKAAQHNVDVMYRYTGATDFNTTNLPSGYGTLAGDQSGVSGNPGPTTIDVGDSSDDDGDPSGGGVSGPGGTGPGGPIATGPDPVTGGPVSGGAPGPNGGPVGTTPGADTTVPGSFTPNPSGPSPVSPTDLGAGRAPGGLVSDAGLVAGLGAEPGAGRGGGARGGVAVPRGGVLGGPGVGAEPGGRAAPGTGTGAASGAAGRGGPGMSGVPLGAGKGRGEEDTERKRPVYLEGGDPDELFDTDVLTAPSTVGAEDD
jgi:hypothetical protein